MDDSTRPLLLLETGVKVGHYVIEHKLGSGGMGVVYLAHDVELDRRVALKFLAPHLSQIPEYKSRFKVEAQAAARLHHRNIVTVFDVAEFRDSPYIVMEYVEGRNLKEEIQDRQFTIDEVLEIGRQLCDALSEAHAKGVVHRDIKPGNIIIDQSRTVRVLDFGLAKFLQPQQDHLSQSGTLIGTVCYMSPEQIRGESIDQRSDIFALGTVIYEILYGKPPFWGETDIAMAQAILSKPPEFPTSSDDNIPASVIEILSRALQKEPKLRFGSAAEMGSSLRGRGESKLDTFKLTRRSKPVSKIVLAAAITLLVAGYLGISSLGDGHKTPMMSTVIAAESATDTIVVLPFRNLTGDSDDDYVAFALTRGVSSRFKYATSLAVRDEGRFEGILSLKNIPHAPDTVNARYVMSGELRKGTNGYTIDCKVAVRGVTTSQIHEETALTSVDELSQAQDRLFQSLLRRLGLDDGRTSTDPFARESLQPETRVLIQKGLYLLTIGQAETALELFRRAKEREPDRFIIDYYLGLANEVSSHYEEAIGHYRLALAEAGQEQTWRTLYESGDSTSLSFPSSYGLDTAWITRYLPSNEREITATKISEMQTVWTLRLGSKGKPLVVRGKKEGTQKSSGSFSPDTLVGIDPTTGERLWSLFDSLGWDGNWNNSKWNYDSDNTFLFENRESKRQWIVDRSTGKTLFEWDYTDSTGHSEIVMYNLVGDTLLLRCREPGGRRFRDFTIDVASQQRLWAGDTLTNIEALDDAGRAFTFRYGKSGVALSELSLGTGQQKWDYSPSAKPRPGIFWTRICGFTEDCVIVFKGSTLYAVRKESGLFKSRTKWKTTFDCSQISYLNYQGANNLGNHLWLRTGNLDSLVSLVWLVDLENGDILQQVDLSALSEEINKLPAELRFKWESIKYFASGDTLIISTPTRLMLFDGKSGRYTTAVEAGYVLFDIGDFSTFFLAGRYACVVDNTRQLAVIYDVDRGEPVSKLALSTIGGRIAQVLPGRNGGIIVAGNERIVEFTPSPDDRSEHILTQDVLNRLAICKFRLGSLVEAAECAEQVLEEHDPNDASAASFLMLCSAVTNDSASISGQLRDYWSLMKEGQPIKEELLSTLNRKFNLGWIAMPARPWPNSTSLALSEFSGTSIILRFRSPGGQVFQSCSRIDGKEESRFLLKSGLECASWAQNAELLIIPCLDYQNSEVVGVDTDLEVVWRLPFAVPEAINSMTLLSGNVIDDTANFLFSFEDHSTDTATAVSVRINTKTGKYCDSNRVLSRHDLRSSWASRWNVAPSYVVWESASPKQNIWSCDSLIVFPVASLGQNFVIKTGTTLGSISYAGDTIAASIKPDRYVAWDLNSRERIFDFAYREGGSTFESTILYFGDQTIIDWDSTSIIALDLKKAGSARPLRWRSPLKSLGKNVELTNRDCRFGNRLFLETTDDRLVVLDFSSGRYLGQVKLLWPAAEFVADKDRVYVASTSGLVYAINYKL